MPTFGEPLALLSDCHRRVEHFLQTLIRVADEASGGPLTTRHREALETALRYFREAAPKHTQDEEESLFPRMRQCDSSEIKLALAKIDALEKDHQRAKQSHEVVEQFGQQWLNRNQLSAGGFAQFAAALRELRAIYEHHIAVEDNEVFPLAGRFMALEQLGAVGREMAERRGQRADDLPQSRANPGQR